jgi:hypothetical protein
MGKLEANLSTNKQEKLLPILKPLNVDEYVVTCMNNQKQTGGTGKRE